MAEAIPQTTTAATGPSVPRRAGGGHRGFSCHAVGRDLRTGDGGLAVRLRPARGRAAGGARVLRLRLWSATLLLRVRNGGAKFALPFLIYALTLAILDLCAAAADRPAAEFPTGTGRPRTDRGAGRGRRTETQRRHNKNLIALGDREPNVSAAATTSSSMRPTKAPTCCF
jgi:hypothetical protein